MNENKTLKQQLLVCLKSFLERLSEEDALYEDLDWFVLNLSEQSEGEMPLYDADRLYSDGVYRE